MGARNKRIWVSAAGTAIAGAALAASPAQGAGYAVYESSAVGLGLAYASGASAADASTIWFNPAGMAFLDDQMMIAGHPIFPRADFVDGGSTAAIGGAPLTGGDDDGGAFAAVPALFGFRTIGEGLKLGLGINAPYGLATEYDDDWIGRYHATTSELTTININPSLAYSPFEGFAIAGGIDIQYAEATLGSAIDFGTIGAGSIGSTPQTLDGDVEVKGDDISFGFNLGVMAEPFEGTRLGLAYRHRISHRLEGDADFTVPAGALALTATGAFTDTTAQAQAISPATASFSFHQELDERWAIMGDVTWTDWSEVAEIRIRFDSVQPDNVTTLEWEDAFRYAIGVTYEATDAIQLRFGAAYDETPVPNAERRTPRVPDNDRFWLSAGLGWRVNDQIQLDVGYAHLFIDDAEIDLTDEPTRGNLIGETEASVDILGAQLTWRFN